jgi:hypothetical protein
MEMAIAIGAWLAFAILAGITARAIAVKVAERKGWTAITMPTVYYLWFLGSYVIVVQGAWLIIYYSFIH